MRNPQIGDVNVKLCFIVKKLYGLKSYKIHMGEENYRM